MTESVSNISEKVGMSPGSLIHVGNASEPEPLITAIDYNKESIDEKKIQSFDDILKYKNTDTVTWVIVEGLTSNIHTIEKIGETFGIHQLVLEDILNTHQRPKFEEYDNYLFIVLKSLRSEGEQFSTIPEQVSIIVLNNFVFTFKERNDDLLSSVIKRVKISKGRLRRRGPDYLTYAIMDTVIDRCFILLDSLDNNVSSLEESLLNSEPSQEMLNTIQNLKREIITIRRYVSPVRELTTSMLHSDSDLIHESTQIYLRDVHDHAIRIIESIESYREILSGLLEIYRSNINNKMNEVMKVLTIFASIFIPLTFLAGIYGMNFEYMPELKWKWAYPSLWIAFIAIPIALIIYFKNKKWL